MPDQVAFTVDGREVRSLDGMTLSAALLSHDVRALRSNPVSGEHRGGFCGMGVCFECEVVVDGRVVRSCLTSLSGGMVVETGLVP